MSVGSDVDGVWFLVYGLAIWRVSFMLLYDYGPFGIFFWIRQRFGVFHDDGDSPISWPRGSVFACLGCMSVWVAAVLWFFPFWGLAIFAGSAAAKLIQGWYER